MATFTLRFKCDNSAFETEPCSEIVRILRVVADRIESGGAADGASGVAMDVNGNSVGEYFTVGL
jgi:hypothetical protein